LCIAAVIEAWAGILRMAVCGGGRPQLSALLYAGEAVLHVALGIVLSARYGALGMAWAVLISVVVMEAMLMLPLTYRQLGDSFLRRSGHILRVVALPSVVTGGLAWIVGRGGGALYVFTGTHSRVLGLSAVAGAGIGLMIVFYALLLPCLPPAQRNWAFERARAMAGRVAGRWRKSAPVSPPPSSLASEVVLPAGPAGNLACS
jgi:hypothetical protein